LYFPTVMSMIVGQNADNPLMGEIARAHEVPCYIADSFAEEYQFYHAFTKSRLDRLYPVFYELCILANIHTARCADIVIDINELATNATARAFVTRKLREIGIDMSLDDCAIPIHAASTPEEKLWLSSERVNGMALRSHQTSPLRIPVDRISAISNGLGRYWRATFDEYAR
jgi:hypothetical protein